MTWRDFFGDLWAVTSLNSSHPQQAECEKIGEAGSVALKLEWIIRTIIRSSFVHSFVNLLRPGTGRGLSGYGRRLYSCFAK
jgi:hypothetical protein